jgi:hypothetical protein
LLPDAEGKFTFTFNRDIARRTGGYEVDSLVGLTISDYGEKAFGVACSATDFVLATPTAGNAVAEMFTATVAGKTLTVKPKFGATPSWATAAGVCKGVKLNYDITAFATLVRAKDFPNLALGAPATTAYDVLVTPE